MKITTILILVMSLGMCMFSCDEDDNGDTGGWVVPPPGDDDDDFDGDGDAGVVANNIVNE